MAVPRVLFVSSEDWAAAPRLPRYMRLAGAEMDAVAPAEAAIAGSSFLSELFETPIGAPDAALDRARALLADGRRYDWVIFGDDVVLDRAVERRDEAWLGPLLPARADRAEALISKCAFSRAMAACGVATPRGIAAAGPAEIAAAARSLGLPVMIKADRGYAGMGIFPAQDAAELEAGAKNSAGRCIVEEKIAGRVGATTALFGAGRPLWWSSFLKPGTWPPPFGPSCRRLAREPAGHEARLEKMGAALGLNGLFGIDWMETADGRTFVIELNGRPIPMNEGSAQVREKLPEALRDFLAGKPVVRRPPEAGAEELWHVLPESFQLAWSEGERLFALKLLLGLGGRVDVPWEDRGLLPRYLRQTVRVCLRRVLLGR